MTLTGEMTLGPRDTPSTEDSEDLVPLSKRIKRLQSGATKNAQENTASDPPALTGEQPSTVKKIGNVETRRTRLKLPEKPTTVVEVDKNNKNRDHSSIAIDKGCSFRESAPTVSKHHTAAEDDKNNSTKKQPSSAHIVMDKAPANVELRPTNQGSSWSLDGVPADEYIEWEAEVIRIHEQAKANLKTGSTSTTPSIEAPCKQQGDSSITPEYAPPPRRSFKLAAALQSRYVEIAPRKVSFKCSKEVCMVYDAVCTSIRRSTRAKSRDAPIINYLFNFATLGHLVESVKPGGKLKNTVAEIAIYVINGKKTRGATRCVLPLHVSTLLQNNKAGMAAVTRVFKKETNHLDHRQLILLPVLQKLVDSDEHSGHYFLIVLNLCNKRFEVLDSMRTLENRKLAERCNKITGAIKSLWKTYYAETNNPIDNYELVDVPVPKQKNNHDCGFHMLINVEYWDGCTVCNVKANDISNIRKIFTHKWLSYEENDTEWERILNLE
ncbi:hypothetical protein C2845_PM07G17890 [Panicum miliaceum]|uniref:Ubiquitin-like protease family profile domain-containing protein n=1 Tax=Panicum miliaceum TaxID=4540 RepID=A0A3L6SSM9_PANMI|nr:hypothetical protein C2845_PM07G17890 [Panicum miliaceum]